MVLLPGSTPGSPTKGSGLTVRVTPDRTSSPWLTSGT